MTGASFLQIGAGLSGYTAELGAAFLCADLQVANDPRPDHAAYVGHWLTVLGQDRKAVFTAARLAQSAAEHLYTYSAT